MLDAVTLDQLRTFIAAAEQGSFSAAGRKLRRAQSVVSQTLANLEGQLGVTLFDRSARYPTLTEAAKVVTARKLTLPFTAAYKPSQIKEAIEHAERGGKILLDFN